MTKFGFMQPVSPTKKILLVCGSIANNLLIVEICAQIDRTIRVATVPNEDGVVPYLRENASKRLPGLIIFAVPSVTRRIAWLVEDLRKNPLSREIPVAFILFSPDSFLMQGWLDASCVMYFHWPSKPSELKLYLRETIECYVEARAVDDSVKMFAHKTVEVGKR